MNGRKACRKCSDRNYPRSINSYRKIFKACCVLFFFNFSEVQEESLEIIDKVKPIDLAELRLTMDKTKRYIKKIQDIQSQMQQCNELLLKIQKNAAALKKENNF